MRCAYYAGCRCDHSYEKAILYKPMSSKLDVFYSLFIKLNFADKNNLQLGRSGILS